MKKLKIISFFLVLLLFALIFFNSCKKDTVEDFGKPSLPPQSSFAMDTSAFPKLTKKTYGNVAYAYGNVLVWNVAIFVGLAVPVASLNEAIKHECTKVETNKWVWAFSVVAPDKATYTCQLYATVTKTEVNWEMKISKASGFQNFTWYTGVSKIDGTQGTWTLFDNPLSNKQIIGIEWHHNADNTADIKYTNIVPSGSENGGYIQYGTTKNTLNAFYSIFTKGKNNLTQIEWNITTHEGHVKDAIKFGDSKWHCWNTTLQDITCP